MSPKASRDTPVGAERKEGTMNQRGLGRLELFHAAG